MKDHRILRAWERYGVKLEGADVDAMSAMIKRGDGLILRRDDHGTVHAVRYAETIFIVAYARETIRTFLAPDTFKSGAAHKWNCSPRRRKMQRDARRNGWAGHQDAGR